MRVGRGAQQAGGAHWVRVSSQSNRWREIYRQKNNQRSRQGGMKAMGAGPQGAGVALRTPLVEGRTGSWGQALRQVGGWVPRKVPPVKTEVGEASTRKSPGFARMCGHLGTGSEAGCRQPPAGSLRGKGSPLDRGGTISRFWAGRQDGRCTQPTRDGMSTGTGTGTAGRLLGSGIGDRLWEGPEHKQRGKWQTGRAIGRDPRAARDPTPAVGKLPARGRRIWGSHTSERSCHGSASSLHPPEIRPFARQP